MTSTVSPGFTRFAAACKVANAEVAEVPALLSLPISELTKYVVMSHTPPGVLEVADFRQRSREAIAPERCDEGTVKIQLPTCMETQALAMILSSSIAPLLCRYCRCLDFLQPR